MTRTQYKILCGARTAVAKARKKEAALERINRDPEEQHCWDDWKDAAGLLSGLESGLGWLEAFIEAGKGSGS